MSFKGVITVIKNSRWYSADMTVFSCFACFLYALGHDGNVLNGIIAFIGILFAHMATNLFDDYSDYNVMLKNPRAVEFVPDVKCDYLRNNKSSINDLIFVIIFYCLIAMLAGLVLLFTAGKFVFWLGLAGGLIVLSYPLFSRVGLSEVAVGLAFGPLLFEGMYYVMTKEFSLGILLLGLAIVMFTIGVMYVHTLLDYESDKISDKRTLALRFNNKDFAMNFYWFIYSLGYIFLLVFVFVEKRPVCLAAFLTLPFVFALYKSISAYSTSENYSRDLSYLTVLKGSAKLMALFSFLISIGLFILLFKI